MATQEGVAVAAVAVEDARQTDESAIGVSALAVVNVAALETVAIHRCRDRDAVIVGIARHGRGRWCSGLCFGFE